MFVVFKCQDLHAMRQEFYTLFINLDYENPLEDVEVAVAIATKCSYCAILSREGGDEG